MTRWQKNLYSIFIAELLAIAGFGVSNPIIPFFIQDLGITDENEVKLWVGLCNAVPAMSLAVFAPIWGKIADSYGRRIMLLRAMYGGAVIMALTGLVSHPWQFLVIRILQGTVTGSVSAATVLVASLSPKEKMGYSLGLVQTAIYVGAAAGPMIGGTVSDMLGYRPTFFITSFLLVIAGLIVQRFVREDFSRLPFTRSFWRNIVPDLGLVSHSGTLIALLFVIGSVQIAGSVIAPILPLYVQSMTPDSNLVGSITGLIFGVGALTAAVSAAAIGRISYRFGYWRTLIICVFGAMLLIVPQAFVGNPWQLLSLRFIGGVFIGGTMPSVNALIAVQTDKAHQGEVYGMSSSISAMGMAIGPIMGALVSMLWGYSAAFLATAVVLLLTAVMLLATRSGGRSGAVSS